jgi:hypothetical protein
MYNTFFNQTEVKPIVKPKEKEPLPKRTKHPFAPPKKAPKPKPKG